MNDKYDFDNIDYGPIDLCACFAPIFDPPEETLREWEQRWKEVHPEPEPTLENTSVYAHEPDGLYFCCGKNYCIKVSERFADNGKEIKALIEDVIQYSVNQEKKRVKLVE